MHHQNYYETILELYEAILELYEAILELYETILEVYEAILELCLWCLSTIKKVCLQNAEIYTEMETFDKFKPAFVQ